MACRLVSDNDTGRFFCIKKEVGTITVPASLENYHE